MAANYVVGGRVWPKIKLIQAFMVVLFTCKNEEDTFKNEGTWVVITDLLLVLWDFRDTQEQFTPQSEDSSAWNTNSSKLLWLTLLPTRMKKIQS